MDDGSAHGPRDTNSHIQPSWLSTPVAGDGAGPEWLPNAGVGGAALPAALHERLERADISIMLDRPLTSDNPLDYFEVAVTTVDAERIGSFEIVRAPLGHPDVWWRLDELSVDLSQIGAAVIDAESGELLEDLDEVLQGAGESWLILHSAQLQPPWRGYGVGALLAGIALQRLSMGAVLAATYPGPLNETPDAAAHEAAVTKLGHTWARLSFTPFRNGVWITDLALRDLDEALRRLQRQYLDPTP